MSGVPVRLGLVPQDTRPVSLSRVLRLADAGGCDVFTPDRSLLGHREHPGDVDWIHEGALSVANQVQAWVLSLDMFVHGGLVPSRYPAEGRDVLIQRLRRLRVLRQAAPGRPLLGFQAIRRLGGWVGSEADLETWREEQGGAGDPSDRTVGHEVNLAAIDMAHEGSLDVLNLLQEDAAAEGPHRAEQEALASRVELHRIADRVTVTAGCDEGAMVLVARALAQVRGTAPLRVALRFSSAAGAARVAPYEDRPLAESARGQLRAAGVVEVDAGDSPDLVLAIWCPDRPGKDLFLEPPPGGDATATASDLVGFVEAEVARGTPVTLADVADTNGADPAETPALARSPSFDSLVGYAAWNTASNALGGALAQGMVAVGGGDPAKLRGVRDRGLLEDWGFQAVLRPRLLKWIDLERKGDPWCLDPHDRARAETFLETHLRRFAEVSLPGRFDPEALRFGLPWSRAFEVEVVE